MTERMLALGLASGASMDGVDVALIETDGEKLYKRGYGAAYPYSGAQRAAIAAAADLAAQGKGRPLRNAVLQAAGEAVTQAHVSAIRAFLAANRIPAARVDVFGFRGQTILHRPSEGIRIQIGDAERLSALAGADVVYEFGAADLAAGGRGAPLMPVYHRALVQKGGLTPPLAVVNIGDVARLTWIGSDGSLLAFDTGPGNVLMNEWALRQTGEAMDRNGMLARKGKVQWDAVDAFLAHPYFEKKPPKSLDRNELSLFFVEGIGIFDAAATLAAITAEAIARAQDLLPESPKMWVVAGGGAHNPVLMTQLRNRLSGRVETARGVGWSGAFMKAEASAYLAVRSLRGRPITFPETTGAFRPTCGGIAVTPAQRSPAQASRIPVPTGQAAVSVRPSNRLSR